MKSKIADLASVLGARALSLGWKRLFVGATATLLACSGAGASNRTTSDGGVELGEECQRYLKAYETCMRSSLPDHPELAAARVDAAREALLRAPDAETSVCAAGTARLRSSCL